MRILCKSPFLPTMPPDQVGLFIHVITSTLPPFHPSAKPDSTPGKSFWSSFVSSRRCQASGLYLRTKGWDYGSAIWGVFASQADPQYDPQQCQHFELPGATSPQSSTLSSVVGWSNQRRLIILTPLPRPYCHSFSLGMSLSFRMQLIKHEREISARGREANEPVHAARMGERPAVLGRDEFRAARPGGLSLARSLWATGRCRQRVRRSSSSWLS